MGATSASRDPVRVLAALARTFGSESAHARVRLLEALASQPRIRSSRLSALQDLLLFTLAYPDDRDVHACARALVPRLREWAEMLSKRERARLADSGLSGTTVVDTFGYPLLARLCRLFPGDLELDWDTLDDLGPLQAAVSRTLHGSEVPGLDDVTLDWDDWFAAARGISERRDLEVLLDLFARARLTPAEREWRFDSCGLAARWTLVRPGSARAEHLWPVREPDLSSEPPRKLRGPLTPLMRRPVRVRLLAPGDGARFVDFAAGALATRQCEIRPLSYGNPADVNLAECGAGLTVALVGVVAHYREALESLYTALILRNGVPIAYGPASVAAGCCELGLNLFPEFRGLETRHVYAQYMRALHHVLGARLFFLTPYGMGVGNPEALAAGSFWFYRRLGFRPTNPAVETLARAEERRLATHPGQRSSLATLRRLSDTSVRFALTRPAPEPLPLGRIGLAVTRRIQIHHRGDRERARLSDARDVARALGLGRARNAALELLSPVLALVPDLAHLPRSERRHLAHFLAAKDSARELGADAELCAANRFLAGLRAAASH